MRKSRTSHVKCDCGEKTTHKCVHLKTTLEGHRGKFCPRELVHFGARLTGHVSAVDSCCCNHGGRCTCTHKKETSHLEPVPESDSDQDQDQDGSSLSNSKVSSKGGPRRRRANTIHSDGMLTFDENGHHKPTYKHTKASQKAGPYQLHRVNSLHSSSSNRSLDNLSRGSSASSGGLLQEQRKAKSEATSPLMTGSSSFMQLNSSLPPLDLSNIGYTPYITDNLDNIFGSVSDHEPALFSAGLSASVDWSHYDGLEFASKANENFAPSSFSQPQSFGGFEQPPTLTTSTSGEVSEVEDFIPSTGDDFDIMGTFSRTSTTSTGFNLGPTQANLLGSTDLTTIDYEDFKFMKAGNKFLPSPASLPGEESSLVPTTAVTSMNNFSLVEDDPAFWMADYSSHTLPIMTESPDPNAPSFWDTQ